MAELCFVYQPWCHYHRTRIDLSSDPCPSVMAGGLGGLSIDQHWLEGAGDMPTAARAPATLRFKYRSWGGHGGRETVNLEAEPCPVVMSDSVGGIELKKVWLEDAGDMAVVDPATGALVPARQVAAQVAEGHPRRRGALPDDHGAGGVRDATRLVPPGGGR